MKYGLGILLVLVALALGGFGILFKQFGLDVTGVLVGLLAIGVFFWSYLHLSLSLQRPLSRKKYVDPLAPRSDKEQAARLGNVIFRSTDDPDVN